MVAVVAVIAQNRNHGSVVGGVADAAGIADVVVDDDAAVHLNTVHHSRGHSHSHRRSRRLLERLDICVGEETDDGVDADAETDVVVDVGKSVV